MKRFIAAIIDIFVFNIFNGILAMLLVRLLGPNVDLFMNTILINYYMFFVFIVFCLYFFIADYKYSGITVGKKIMEVQPYQHREKTMEYAYVHALIKVAACIFWPITIIYFVTHNNTMFYDTILSIESSK